jgi:acid phosphatase (class A)
MRFLPSILLVTLTLGGCTVFTGQPTLAPMEEVYPGFLPGYLSPEELPDLVAMLPPPPAKGSARLALDRDASAAGQVLRGTPRWELAKQDAELHFPAAAATYTCALGAPITEQNTPHLYRLLRRVLVDAGFATHAIKNHYQRKRPFQENGQPTCTPDQEQALTQNASYPSGHAALGWAWALVLSEVAPERSDMLLKRGRAFAQSRVVCNVHWQSDVNEGREAGTAAFMHLHGNADFMADLARAKEEYQAVKGQNAHKNCEAEAAALAR